MQEGTSGRGARSTVPVPRHAVTDLEQWVAVTRLQLVHYVRTNRFFGLFGFVLLVSALALAFQVEAGSATVQVQQLHRSSEYITNNLVYIPLWLVLAAAFFGGDALSVDFSTGAGYFMLVLPIRRPVLLAGRYAAAVLVTLAVGAVYYAFAVAGAVYFFGAPSIAWGLVGVSFGVAALYTLAALSVAFTVSAFVRSPAGGVLITILAVYVGFTTLQSLVELAGIEPWFSLPYAGGAIAAVLDTDFLHQQTELLGSQQSTTIWVATVTEGVAIMLGYVAVFLPLSVGLYQRKESTG